MPMAETKRSTKKKSKEVFVSTTTTVHNRELTQDLIHEILVRLPAKSLVRFQLLSKQWQSLIFNPVFRKSHLEFNRSKYPPLSLLIHRDTYSSVTSLKFGDGDGDNSSVESTKLDALQLQLSTPPPSSLFYSYEYYPFGSSEGLIGVYNQSARSIYLWNPTTKEHRQISSPRTRMKECNTTAIRGSGFGFVPSINDYKIVMFSSSDTNLGLGTWIGHIYTMRDNRWRDFGITLPIALFFSNMGGQIPTSVLCNQALHWVGAGPNHFDSSLPLEWSIFKFDLVTEVLEEIPLSKHIKINRGYLGNPTIGVIEPNNNLAVCLLYKPAPFPFVSAFLELWKLERYGEWDSWNKVFKFDCGKVKEPFRPRVLGVASCGNVLIQIRNRLAFVNATCDRLIYLLDDDLDHGECQYPVVNYVPSLASPYCYVPMSPCSTNTNTHLNLALV